MCGRFSLGAMATTLTALFDLPTAPAWTPRYNIAPRQEALMVVHSPEGKGGNSSAAGASTSGVNPVQTRLHQPPLTVSRSCSGSDRPGDSFAPSSGSAEEPSL
jgi:putative SOS response-associated peptidase YedK